MQPLACLRIALASVLVFAVFGCGSSGKKAAGSEKESVAEALSKHVHFAHQLTRRGDIGKEDDAARKVKLSGAAGLHVAPNADSLMSLDVENPDQDDNAAKNVLCQFAGSSGHSEIPVKEVLADQGGGDDAGSSGGDAGAGSDTDQLHLDVTFEVDGDICESLCNRRFTAQLIVAIALADGSISEQQLRSVTLDCSDDGDPKQCGDDDENGGGENDDGGGGNSAEDAGSGSTGNPTDGGSSGSRDAGSGGADAGPSMGAGNPPQIGPITPASATAGTAVTLMIAGTGFIDGAVAYVNGTAMDTTFDDDTALTAAVTKAATTNPGSLAVYVENTPGDVTSRSNVLYLQVDPAPGAPVIYDYSPDNGVAGDTILIIASNLSTGTLEITDSNGNTLKPGALSTISWPNAGSADTVEVVLPKGIETGPITVANDLGSFQGKIFTVGHNLTREDGTTLDSSTEYNTGNWSRMSGGDNLLATSFFTAHGDCATVATCTTKPWFQITFASDQTVARIAMRGNREYASGYDFLRGTFQVLDASDKVLWKGDYELPEPDRDLDVTLPAVDNARKVKFLSLADESDEPGFSELEVFAE
jgi:hypothetical protein